MADAPILVGGEGAELTRLFAKDANGFERSAVVSAGGNMVLNAIRQSHRDYESAERELDDIFARMKDALRHNHYTDAGTRRQTTIVVPTFDQVLFEDRSLIRQ